MQQELLYKQCLFVGCSMTDDNVHLIIDQVRKALYKDMEPEQMREIKMGTILTLVENPMFRRLWEDDFDIVSCCEAEHASEEKAHAAWIHDALLDCIGWMSERGRAYDAFILDAKFGTLLEDWQLQVKEALQPLVRLYGSDEVRESPGWESVVSLLKMFGEKFDSDGRPLAFSRETRTAVKEAGLFRLDSALFWEQVPPRPSQARVPRMTGPRGRLFPVQGKCRKEEIHALKLWTARPSTPTWDEDATNSCHKRTDRCLTHLLASCLDLASTRLSPTSRPGRASHPTSSGLAPLCSPQPR